MAECDSGGSRKRSSIGFQTLHNFYFPPCLPQAKFKNFGINRSYYKLLPEKVVRVHLQ